MIKLRLAPQGALGLLVAVAGCTAGNGGEASDGSTEAATPYRGQLLAPAPKPDFTLTDVNGDPFDFRRQTRDGLALLFFGYASCPDICPVHMAGIAAVLRDLPWEVRDRVSVVFVTTDPERDTPERLGRWLAGFDRSFVGLRGAIEEVNRLQASLDLPPAVRLPASEGSDGYEVGHAAQVLAFGADGLRLAYPFGTRQEDWMHDLPLLVATLP